MGKLSRTQTIAIAFVMAVAGAVPIALAQSTDAGEGTQKEHRAHRGDRGMRGGRHMERGFFRNLDLTDAQKAQMKQIRESHSQALRPLETQVQAKRREIRNSSEGGTFDEAAVTQKLTEIAPLEAKLMGERFRLHQEMLSVLTPEQKTKLDQSRQQFKSKWAERRANKRMSK